jgi:phenol 2-monooxygenase
MEILESFGIDQDVTKLWEPGTDEILWFRDEKKRLVRMERHRNRPPPGVRFVVS